MLEEQIIRDDMIRVHPDGQIEVREATVLLRNGARDLSFPARYRRYILTPGDDLSSCPARIIAVAASVWSPEIVAAWKETVAQAGG
jgi:hypothetical protein